MHTICPRGKVTWQGHWQGGRRQRRPFTWYLDPYIKFKSDRLISTLHVYLKSHLFDFKRKWRATFRLNIKWNIMSYNRIIPWTAKNATHFWPVVQVVNYTSLEHGVTWYLEEPEMSQKGIRSEYTDFPCYFTYVFVHFGGNEVVKLILNSHKFNIYVYIIFAKTYGSCNSGVVHAAP